MAAGTISAQGNSIQDGMVSSPMDKFKIAIRATSYLSSISPRNGEGAPNNNDPKVDLDAEQKIVFFADKIDE